MFMNILSTSIRTTLTCLAISGAAFVANADIIDLGVLEPGVTYEFPQYETVYGEYIPSVSGPVKFLYSTSPLTLYSSKDLSEQSLVSFTHSYVETGQMYTYQLEAGETYYLYSALTMDAGTLKIQEGKMEVELIGVSPNLSDGEMFSVSSNYIIDLSFNTPVNIGNVLLIAGDEKSRITAKTENTYVTCNVADAIMDFYNRGVLKKGDVMTLRVMNVTDAYDNENKYNDNGKLEVDFVMNAKPAQLIEVVNATMGLADNPFNSYYLTGDEAATISFVFDEELSTEKTPTASISYGNSDNIDVGMYKEDVIGKNEGNTADFDFSGKLRRPIDMLPASTAETQPEFLGIVFYDIYSADGQRVYTGSQSNPTGYSMSFKLNVVQYTIATDYTPGRGSILTPGSTMEIWVMNGAFISSSGINLSYVSNGEVATTTIPMADVKVEEDPLAPEDLIYTFTIPNINVDPDTKVTITFADVECGDGLDHSGELTAQFGFQTSGVGNIFSEIDDTMTVYNSAGICVMNNVPHTELDKLPKGLYIVNGKKIVKK